MWKGISGDIMVGLSQLHAVECCRSNVATKNEFNQRGSFWNYLVGGWLNQFIQLWIDICLRIQPHTPALTLLLFVPLQ